MPVDVLTNRYDNSRTGVNSREVTLRPSGMGMNTFGRLFGRTVDGDLYAQPLIVSDLWIGGGWRNVVYLATSRNWVYAYDADDPAAFMPIWVRQLGPPVPREAINPTYANFNAEIGITSTPVIERTADGGTIFLAAKTYRPGRDDASFSHHIHALDLVTGENRTRPVAIEASLKDRPAIRFSPFHNLNRPGLLLSDGVLYLAFGSHDDEGPYFGWILAYDASTLGQLAAYNTAPDWGEGGVWQSGTGLAADLDGNVYAVVGNGSSPRNAPTPAVNAPEYGNALLKLKLDRAAGVLVVQDWYTASDVFDLNTHDDDLIGGPVLFEHSGRKGGVSKFVLGGGKDGKFYLADRDHMGHWVPMGSSNICQAEKVCQFHIHGAPVVWVRSNRAISAFVWSEQDTIKQIDFKNRAFGPEPSAQSTYGFPRDEFRMPGGVLTLSWNGSDPDTAILWALHPTRENAMNKTVAGTLRAYKATNLGGAELWTSDMDAFGGDRIGNLAKFSPPIVANGKVYVGTFSRELVVYGLLPATGPNGTRKEYGIFEFRGIGDGAIPEGGFAGGQYSLRLSGANLGSDAPGHPPPNEGFVFANLQRNTGLGAITVSAQLKGINAADYPAGRAGLMIRRDVQSFQQHPQESVGYAAIVVTQDMKVRVVIRDHVPIAAPVDTINPVRTVGENDNLTFPARFRLTAQPSDGRPGFITVKAEVASPRTSPFRPIGRAEGFDVEFDTADIVAAGIDLSVGLFATAQQEVVREDAAPAYAYFSNVLIP